MRKINMKISNEKSKTMITSTKGIKHRIDIKEQILEQVKSYKYLGIVIGETETIDKEIIQNTGKAGRLYNSLRTLFLEKKEM